MMLVGHWIVMCRIDIKLMLLLMLLQKVIDAHGCSGLWTVHILRKHLFRFFGPSSPLLKQGKIFPFLNLPLPLSVYVIYEWYLSVGQEISRHFALALHFDLATAIELVSLSILQNVINFLGL